MKQLSIVSSGRNRADDIARQFAGIFAVRALGLDELAREAPDAFTLVDIDLNGTAYVDDLRRWLQLRPKQGMTLFAVDKSSRIQTVRAYSIGATDIVFRPICRSTLLGKLRKNSALPDIGPSACEPEYSCGIAAGISALQKLFAAASSGIRLNSRVIAEAGEALVKHIEAYGFADWVQAIRIHHDQTYQHCLLVSGAAAAFAQHLGFSGVDRRRVAMAGLLHDTGKVRIPVAILEKPGRLNDQEMAQVRLHPVLGHDALQAVDGLHPEMLDMVLHHHEYLDGSGYPHRLRGNEISDLTRLVTIADIFGALIERRAYRPAMSGNAAYQVLLDMGPKLDGDLVRAFQPLSGAQFE
jgi:HD-GYP domain-containing protein (c-di-GMP phosphodiesterase class II)